ncbi:hypothetical protein CNH03015 [Cryptococcus deneoformans JEC21]|uniref:Transposase n=1 Tax=Cryptococcus deneoformans (strain JEC21 / ATCC MYA-565) TaxID=214684 RepID=A0A0S2M5S1_CRYD1|nr:hypothetical protein CNH03015 [Cryptococcus neoformans var. neoformans JEC21]ALO69507.1 hypothetical protein CNH03015 [Cryptococcus neoformans var. neoformans JEC21]
MSSISFNISVVRLQLREACKGREKRDDESQKRKNANNWIVDWKGGDLSDASIENRRNRWIKDKCHGTLQQMDFVAGVLEYMTVLERLKNQSGCTPSSFPFYGPLFSPPSLEELQFRGKSISANPSSFLVEPVLVVHPLFYPEMVLDKCPKAGCQSTVKRKGWKPFRSVYGVDHNIKVVSLQYICAEHGVYSPSADTYWEGCMPWEQGLLPHFLAKTAVTRELYDLIAEVRPKSSVNQLVENIHQLHILYSRRLETRFYAAALRERTRMSFFNQSATPFPMMLQRAEIKKDDGPPAVRTGVSEDNITELSGNTSTGTSGNDNEIAINPSPSFDTVRACYEDFVARQRKHESSQYIRTLSGLIAAVDATMKVANKASVYSRTNNGKMQVVNPFAGGLLTGVNEDKELVFWEFLPNNSPAEMQGPLLEFAERCHLLGQNFSELGEVVVDRCCDFRRRIHEALPEVSVVQDFYHVKERIMRTLPANSDHRHALSTGLPKRSCLHGQIKKAAQLNIGQLRSS